MASTRIIEQDHGTYAGSFTHHHNGYYAGDFSQRGTVRTSVDTSPRNDLADSRATVGGQGLRLWMNETSPVLTA
jgi:hypothetical protein